jgi:hypothetical protein
MKQKKNLRSAGVKAVDGITAAELRKAKELAYSRIKELDGLDTPEDLETLLLCKRTIDVSNRLLGRMGYKE